MFYVSLDANGSAGLNPVIEWAALSMRSPFSWGFALIVAACIIICTCLASAAWMLKAHLEHRRALAMERQFQLRLAERGMPVSVRVPSVTIEGLAPML